MGAPDVGDIGIENLVVSDNGETQGGREAGVNFKPGGKANLG